MNKNTELAVLKALKERPKTKALLCEDLGLCAHSVSAALRSLEIKKMIRKSDLGWFFLV